ncbi:MAG: hypothetical protein QXV17_14015 [Candidatus Micrarchaeaceae archaeon]
MITPKSIEEFPYSTERIRIMASQIGKEHIDLAIQRTYSVFHIKSIYISLLMIYDIINDFDDSDLKLKLSNRIRKRVFELIVDGKIDIYKRGTHNILYIKK